MIMIVGFSEIPLYSAIRTRTQLALIKELGPINSKSMTQGI